MPIVRLLTEHTHGGVKYYPGQEVEMSAADARWYASTVVAERQEKTLFIKSIQDMIEAPVVAPPEKKVGDELSWDEVKEKK